MLLSFDDSSMVDIMTKVKHLLLYLKEVSMLYKRFSSNILYKSGYVYLKK